jgi:predicted O-methyltransferase YrrM
MSGQIQNNSNFGKVLKTIAQRADVKNIVEIGTWNGLGSTLCILESIQNKETTFISIELIKEMYNHAKNNLRQYSKVILLNGAIITAEDLNWFNVEEAKCNFTSIEREHFDLHYMKEVEAIKTANNVLDQIPETIDFLILDGGEYSTYPEWQKLKSRTKIVAIDDTTVLKSKKIRSELLSDNEWQLVTEDQSDRNGYSVFERK